MVATFGQAKVWDGSAWVTVKRPWMEGGRMTEVNKNIATSVTVTSGNGVKGSWIQLVASTSADANFLVLIVHDWFTSGATRAGLIDVGIGAAGSEVAVASNIAVSQAGPILNGTSNGGGGIWVQLPLQIPAGSRIALRAQRSTGGANSPQVRYGLYRFSNSVGASSVDTYGALTGGTTSQGTSLSSTATTWTQITGSTTQAYRGLAVVTSMTSGTYATNGIATVQVGTGAAGSEVVLFSQLVDTDSSDWVTDPAPFHTTNNTFTSRVTSTSTEQRLPIHFETSSQGGSIHGFSPFMGQVIPAGTRISARITAPANGNFFDVVVIGIP